MKRNLQPDREGNAVKQTEQMQRGKRAVGRAHWIKIDRKTGSPSLIVGGEEIYCVCRKNDIKSEEDRKMWRGCKYIPKNNSVLFRL